MALSLRIAPLLVGLTVVAYGTSAPEALVSIQAATQGHGAIALGNIVGSNIANIGLILGVSALVRPARVSGALRRRELPVLLASTLVLPLVLLDGRVSNWEAGGLLVGALSYTLTMVREALGSPSARAAARRDARVEAEAADAAGAPKTKSVRWSAATAIAGLLVLLLGGHFFIEGAVAAARTLRISERVVGLTIVAVGTSLPELVTSVVASLRGHADIAVGNVIGSNIFNVLLCLGAAALSGTVAADLRDVALDLTMLALITAAAAIFIRSERHVSRAEGGVVLAFYVAFMVFVVLAG